MEIFEKSDDYSLPEIINVCDKNGLITVDCLKDENMVSVEKWNNGDGGDCLFEFKRKEGIFKLTWVETGLGVMSKLKQKDLTNKKLIE